MHANGLTREHFYDHQESIHYRETLNAEEFVLMTPPRGPYDNSLFQNIWFNINRISCGHRKTQCVEYTFTFAYKYSLLSTCVCVFYLLKENNWQVLCTLTTKSQLCLLPCLLSRVIFPPALPFLFLLLTDMKPSEYSWFVTLQWGLWLLLESPKPYSDSCLLVAGETIRARG